MLNERANFQIQSKSNRHHQQAIMKLHKQDSKFLITMSSNTTSTKDSTTRRLNLAASAGPKASAMHQAALGGHLALGVATCSPLKQTNARGSIGSHLATNRIRAMPKRKSPQPQAPASLILVTLVVGALCAPSEHSILMVQGQCLDKTMTSFERIGGVTIKDAQLTILYQANTSQATIGQHHISQQQSGLSNPNANQSTTITTLYHIPTPITAECNNRCRRMKECRAFLVDYSRHTCWSVNHPVSSTGGMHHQSVAPSSSSGLSSALGSSSFNVLDRSPAPIHLELTNERTAYFEKVCLNLPITDCERAWIFERVLSYHIQGHDDKIIDDVPSRLKCQEHCLNERQFRCRSGEYDQITMQCRLSMVDRHMKPSLFRPTSIHVDYFENQCVPAGQQCDAFDRFEDMDLGRAEIMRQVNNSEQCQQYCTQTIKAFICRSFTWSQLTRRCYLNSANTFMVGGNDKLLHAPGLVYYQRNDCIDLKLECDTTSMTLNLRTNEPFRGRMYVRDGDPQACAPTLGRSALMSSLSIPFQSPMGRCATRELPSRYSSVVVVQQHPLIQRKSDRYIKLVCDFQTANKTISSSYNVMANPWTSTALINATSFAPKIILRITDKFGNDVTGAKLGDELQLRIEAETDSPYDMVARSVLAKSGSSDAESIVLIDREGCPADFRIFPPLKKLNKRTIIGRFDAFKFSSDAVVRFQVDVQFCLNSCPQTTCLDPSQSLFNVNSQQLAGDNELTNPIVPMSTTTTTTTTSSPTNIVQVTTGGGNNLNEETPEGYMRSSSTTYRPHMQTNPDYLNTNLIDQYNNGQVDNSLRGQPPVNQPLSSVNDLVNHGQVPQPSPSIMSDQLFDPQARDSSRVLAADQSVFSGRTQAPLNQHYQYQRQHQQQQNSNTPNQIHNQKQAHKQTYDGNRVTIQSNGLDGQTSLTADELNTALNPQQHPHQDQHLRRRRRSTEPMPASPKHVPLQREIIIFESASAKGEQSSKAGDSQASRPAQASFANKQQVGKFARGQTESRSMPASSAAKSLWRTQKANSDQGIESNRYDLNRAEQLGAGKPDGTPSNDEPDDGSRALVCTTWASLAFSMLAFCAIQLLTIGICLAGWLHKHKPKQMTGKVDDQRHSEQRFLSQILRQQQQQQQPPSLLQSQRLF